MTSDNNKFIEYSKKVKQLSLYIIDDEANAEFLKSIPDSYLPNIIKKSEFKIEKISIEQIENFESKFKVRVPDFIKFIMTEIGQSRLVCLWFFNNKKISDPMFCFSYDFFNACLKAGLSSDYLNDFNFELMYDNDTNTFKDLRVQEVYESLNSDDKVLIIKLLLTWQGDCSGYEGVILNELNNGQVVFAGSISQKIHIIEDVKYIQFYYTDREVHIEDYCLSSIQYRLDTTYNMSDLRVKHNRNLGILGKIFNWWF